MSCTRSPSTIFASETTISSIRFRTMDLLFKVHIPYLNAFDLLKKAGESIRLSPAFLYDHAVSHHTL